MALKSPLSLRGMMPVSGASPSGVTRPVARLMVDLRMVLVTSTSLVADAYSEASVQPSPWAKRTRTDDIICLNFSITLPPVGVTPAVLAQRKSEAS